VDLFLRKYHRAITRIAIPAIPPTTPPTIAPTGVACVVTMGRLLDDEVGVGMLREVETPSWTPPVLGVMRKQSRMYGLVKLAVTTVRSILWVPSASFGVWKYTTAPVESSHGFWVPALMRN